MLPLVQHFPEDNVISIKPRMGECALVVWTHHILGLSVLLLSGGKEGAMSSHRFGEGPEQVIIDATGRKGHNDRESFQSWEVADEIPGLDSITLLSGDKGEIRLHIEEKYIDTPLVATYKGPARGIFRKILESSLPIAEAGRESLIEEVSHLVAAYAICISESLYVLRRNSRSQRYHKWVEDWNESGRKPAAAKVGGKHQHSEWVPAPRLIILESRIIEASRMLLDKRISQRKVAEYVELLSGIAIRDVEAPQAAASILESWSKEYSRDIWIDLKLDIERMSVMMLAFSNVGDIELLQELPLYYDVRVFKTVDTWIQFKGWDGHMSIFLPYYGWMELIVNMMIGRGVETNNGDCLISENGWSIFYGSLGKHDPSDIGKLCRLH